MSYLAPSYFAPQYFSPTGQTVDTRPDRITFVLAIQRQQTVTLQLGGSRIPVFDPAVFDADVFDPSVFITLPVLNAVHQAFSLVLSVQRRAGFALKLVGAPVAGEFDPEDFELAEFDTRHYGVTVPLTVRRQLVLEQER